MMAGMPMQVMMVVQMLFDTLPVMVLTLLAGIFLIRSGPKWIGFVFVVCALLRLLLSIPGILIAFPAFRGEFGEWWGPVFAITRALAIISNLLFAIALVSLAWAHAALRLRNPGQSRDGGAYDQSPR